MNVAVDCSLERVVCHSLLVVFSRGGSYHRWQCSWVIDPTSLSQLAEFREGLSPMELFGLLHGDMIRPLGIGTLIGGALMGVVAAFPAIKSAFVSLASVATIQ